MATRHVWDDVDLDQDMISSESSAIDDVEDEFLMIVDSVEVHHEECSASLSNFDDRDSTHVTHEQLPPFYEAPKSPEPENVHYRSHNAANVTPDHQSYYEVEVPQLHEIQLQYKRTLKKLARSMKQSDTTRSIVKRQRLFSPQLSVDSLDEERDFFRSSRCSELEASRRKLFKLISNEAF